MPSFTLQRQYSIHADHAALKVQDVDASRLSIHRSLEPKKLLPPEELVFGKNFTGNGPPLNGRW